MKRLVLIISACIEIFTTITISGLAAPEWRIQFRPAAGSAGTLISRFGTVQGASDGLDSSDLQPGVLAAPYVRMTEDRSEWWGAGAVASQDIRAPYSDATKVWTNLRVEGSQLPQTTITLEWQPETTLPQGIFRLIDLSSGQEYDLRTAGSISFTGTGTGIMRRFCMVATVGNGPVPVKVINIAPPGKLQSSATVNGDTIYLGDELNRINSVSLSNGSVKILATMQAAIRGRLVLYGSYLYGVDALKHPFWVNTSNGSATTKTLEANPRCTPAMVYGNGHTYLFTGTPTGICRIDDGTPSNVLTTNTPIGSPAIPGTDQIWFGGEDGYLYCANSALTVIRTTKAVGGKVGDPVVDLRAGKVITGGGNTFGIYNCNNFQELARIAVGANVTSPPYLDYPTGVAYFLSDDNKLHAVSISTGRPLNGWPVSLEGSATRDTQPVASDAQLLVSGGAADNRLYMIDKTVGTRTWLAGNGSFVGSPSLTGDRSKIVIPSTDGNLYVVDNWPMGAGPAISDVRLTTIAESGAVVVWKTGTPADSQVIYGIESYSSRSPLDTALVTNHSRTLTGLKPWTSYVFRVLSRDGQGNISVSGSFSFKTRDATPPSRPVVTDQGAFTTSANSLFASWVSKDPDSGILEYSYAIGTAPGWTDVVNWTSTGAASSVLRSGLSLATNRTYYFSVKARNAAGLWSDYGSSDGIVRKTGSPPTQLRLLPDGQHLLNDAPFFPLFLSPGPPLNGKAPDGRDALQVLREGGLNGCRVGMFNNTAWNTTTEAQLKSYLDWMRAQGLVAAVNLRELSVILTPGDARETHLRSFVQTFGMHPATCAWKTYDEPQWGDISLTGLENGYKILHAIDPLHPAWMNHAPRGTPEQLAPYCQWSDTTGVDIYPVSIPMGKHSHLPNKECSVVGDYVQWMRDIVDDRKPIWMVLQVTFSGVQGTIPVLRPTYKQERFMVYQAIINGARGLLFFGFNTQLDGEDLQLGYCWSWWESVLKPITQEIGPASELYPVISAPNTRVPVTTIGASGIELLARETNGALYILACRREGTETAVPVIFNLPAGYSSRVDVLYENRQLTAADNFFMDSFWPNDVHVYRIRR